MATRQEVKDYILTLIDTPFIHQGRLEHVGVDCVGVPILAAKKFNLFENEPIDIKGYSRVPDGQTLISTIRKATQKEKTFKDIKICDLILMQFQRLPMHIAVYIGDNEIVHAYQPIGKVVRHRLDDKWMRRVVSVYEFYNIED